MLFGLVGCSWAELFAPPRIDAPDGYVHEPRVGPGPRDRVEIFFSEHGVPHIYGGGVEDLAYGLGFVHARDRLFQILVLKHAATGRLGELFGKGLVEEDRRLRLLTYRLEDEEAALPAEARAIAQAYVDGLNEGAAHAGRSLEMQLLGLNASPFEVRDVLAIARLQSWELSLDLRAELARARVAARLPPGDPRRQVLLMDVPTGGVPIVRPAPPFEMELPHIVDDEPLPDSVLPRTFRRAPLVPPPPAPSEPVPPPSSEPPSGGPFAPPSALEIERLFLEPVPGGSNAWVVHGTKTKSARPILVNDPHLSHQAPGVFYLAHLEGDGVSVTGVSLPGIPAIVIGHTPHLAWGMTTSFADTQDLVRLKLSTQRKGRYVVDGKELPLTTWIERFRAGGETLLTEQWGATVFGPVLPPGYETDTEPGETYAVLWSGFDPEATREQLLAFWRLARATTLEEADAALAGMSASQSVLLATRDGHIAYRLTGKIPVRRSSEPTSLPRDGTTSAAGWNGYLPFAEQPAVTNPPEGYLVAANQRIASAEHRVARHIGGYGATPHRAQRIDERLRDLLAEGPADADALLAIQQDVFSVEARVLARLLGKVCPESIGTFPRARAKAFCDAVREFDGFYTVESKGALPFTLLLASVQEGVLAAHLGADVARQLLHQPFVVMAIEESIVAEAYGAPMPLFDDLVTPQREGLEGFVRSAADRALSRLVELAGNDPEGWTWGKVHTLAANGPLARAPVVGPLFEREPRPQSGWHRAPRAEGGLPVRTGAVLRFLAEMGEPVNARLVTDFGNSGHLGTKGYGDLVERWERGELLTLPRTREEVEQQARGRLTLLPRSLAP